MHSKSSKGRRMCAWSIVAASGKERREEGGRASRGRESSCVERGERSPLFSSKVVECVSNKEVVTVCRHIVEVSQYRTFSIFFQKHKSTGARGY